MNRVSSRMMGAALERPGKRWRGVRGRASAVGLGVLLAVGHAGASEGGAPASEGAETASGVESYARVVVQEVELRSGPGITYRLVDRASRGDTFLVVGRETNGYWIEVVLSDGRRAFVLGDAVERIALTQDAPEASGRPGIFAPPALQSARGGFTLQGGVLDGDALGEVRPAWFFSPELAFEPYVGVALQRDGRRVVYGGALSLNLAPDWAVAPYFLLGAGGILEEPRDDVVRPARRAFHARAGGGLLISLRWRVLVRLEATNLVRFAEDSYDNEQSYTGGLGTYF